MRLMTQVVGQLDLHRSLDQPLGQRRQQPTRPGDLLLGPRTHQQPVDHLIGNPLATGPLDHPTQSGAVHGAIHPLPAHSPRLLSFQGGRRRVSLRPAAGAIRMRITR
jgi:hypothetical protein